MNKKGGKMAFNYVYLITNIKNYKKYIGMRSSNTEPDSDLGIHYFSSSHDAEFIADQKKNPFNYIYDILGIFESREEAIAFEEYLHSVFKVSKSKEFYNMASQRAKGFDGGAGESHFRARKIYQCDPNTGEIIKEWSHIEEAARALGGNACDISGCARGRNKTSGGFIWIYVEDFNEAKINDIINTRKDLRIGSRHYRAKPILQIDLKTKEIIREWECITEANNFYRTKNIQSALSGRQKQVRGFGWKYKEER